MKSNLRKIFIYIVTNRRHYIILTSVFFLMQEWATEKLLWYSMSLGMLAGFLLEVPSGYLADRFGHKKTLILSKICMLIATLCYVFGWGYVYLMIASVFIALGFAFASGTIQAFTHETLESLWREDEYSGIMSKIKWKASLIQVATFALLPMLAEFNILIPFYIWIGIDLLGLWVATSLVQPVIHKKVKRIKNLREIMKEWQATDFYYVALFFSFIGSFFIGFTTFREPYLLSLDLAVFYIWIISAWSRLARRGFSHFTWRISKNVTLSQLMVFEMFFFAFYFLSVALLPNIYFVGVMLALGLGYRYARSPVISQYIIKQLPDQRYKSTALSMKSQLGMLFWVATPLLMWYFVSLDVFLWLYRDWIALRGVVLFMLLGLSWLLWKSKKQGL